MGAGNRLLLPSCRRALSYYWQYAQMKHILRNAKLAARGRSNTDLSWEIPLAGGSLRVSWGRVIACCFPPVVVRGVIIGNIHKYRDILRNAKRAAGGRSNTDLSWEIPLAGGILRVSEGREIACCFLPDVVRELISDRKHKSRKSF